MCARRNDKKKGLSSHLTISCECGYVKETYTSNVVNKTIN